MTDNGHEKGALDSLFEILGSEENLSNELLNLLDQEQTALTAVDLKGLISLSQKKNKLAVQIHNLDETIQHVAKKMLGEDDRNIVKLSSLESKVDTAEAGKLKGFRQRLNDLRRKIHDCNMINKKFAEDTLGYINDGISMISGAVAAEGEYQGRVGLNRASNGPVLINREV